MLLHHMILAITRLTSCCVALIANSFQTLWLQSHLACDICWSSVRPILIPPAPHGRPHGRASVWEDDTVLTGVFGLDGYKRRLHPSAHTSEETLALCVFPASTQTGRRCERSAAQPCVCVCSGLFLPFRLSACGLFPLRCGT